MRSYSISIFIENWNWDLKLVFRLDNEKLKRKKSKIRFNFKRKIECLFSNPWVEKNNGFFVLIEIWNSNSCFLNFAFVSIAKLNFCICIKFISKNNIYFRSSRFFFFSISRCWGLSKRFSVEKGVASCFNFFYSFIQKQWIRCK